MAPRIDLERAEARLQEKFAEAEARYVRSDPPPVSEKARSAADVLFRSAVQSYREAVLGCAVAKVVDPKTDIRLPYVKQGRNAFSGRTLDEKVINPFFVAHNIPCSRGAYLASFRRSVRFVDETADGLRDRNAYRGMLDYLEELERADLSTADDLLCYLLFRFIELRDQSDIPLSKPQRMSLDQYTRLVDGLVSEPSGGLFPELLVVALLRTVAQVYHLDWDVSWQGTNVSDRAHSAGGDITVAEKDQVRVVLEVTERVIDRSRVEATFRSKILPLGIKDYLFVFAKSEPAPEAQMVARQLFAQGHEVGFVQVRDWVANNLALAGSQAREVFLEILLGLLSEAPAVIKSRWNSQVRRILEV